MAKPSKVCVLGSGSWGTALAHHLSRAGHEVVLWGRDSAVVNEIESSHLSRSFFPNDQLHPELRATTDLKSALAGREVIVISTPSSAYREIARQIKNSTKESPYIVSTAKGLEEGTLYPLSKVLAEELLAEKIAVLSGPSFALEVLRGLPTAVTVAAKHSEVTEKIAAIFHSQQFRVYTSRDVIGVEYGGVLKNVIALAAGIVEGTGMGSNARAALITRGIAEMQRLVVCLGGQAETVAGLSGLGDLLLTATGDLSRNRQVGIRLGKGEKLDEILKSIGQIAEGVKTTHKALELAHRHNVKVPIIQEVDNVLNDRHSPMESAKVLLSREIRGEIDF